MSQGPVIQVSFKRKLRKFENLGQCLEREVSTGKFYARVKIHRGSEPKQFAPKETRISVPGTTITAARKNLNHWLDQFDQFEIGRASENPFARVQGKVSVEDLAKGYIEGGCPKHNGQPRTGNQLKYELARIARLLPYYGRIEWDKTADHYTAYFRFRKAQIKRAGCDGERSVDMEHETLAAILQWAKREKLRTGVTGNPVEDRPSFRSSEKVRHARDCMPQSGEELHRLVSVLFQDPKSQAFGWLALAQAKIGHRVETMTLLRRDAREPHQPGFIDRDGRGVPQILYLVERHAHKSAKGHFIIDDDFREFLEAWEAWIEERYPNSPWFFPSPQNAGENHVFAHGLSKALQRARQVLEVKEHRTSHGLRAFAANVLRSIRDKEGYQKLSDPEIADRLGHEGGTKMLREVYGDPLPYPIFWMPGDRAKVAWKIFTTPIPRYEPERPLFQMELPFPAQQLELRFN